MTKRDFFRLIIKLFGLASIITSLFTLYPSFYSYGMFEDDTMAAWSMLIGVVIVLTLFVVLIFKPDIVIDFLDLDKGFDDDKIDFKHLTAVHIIQIGIIIIGGLLILDNIAGFISHTYFAFKTDIAGDLYGKDHKLSWAIGGINLVIGYLLLANHVGIAKFLNRKTKPS